VGQGFEDRVDCKLVGMSDNVDYGGEWKDVREDMFEGKIFISRISEYSSAPSPSSSSSSSSASPAPFVAEGVEDDGWASRAAEGSGVSSSWQYIEGWSPPRWIAWRVISGYATWKILPVDEAKMR